MSIGTTKKVLLTITETSELWTHNYEERCLGEYNGISKTKGVGEKSK